MDSNQYFVLSATNTACSLLQPLIDRDTLSLLCVFALDYPLKHPGITRLDLLVIVLVNAIPSH